MPLSDDDWNFAAQNTPNPGVIASQAATANPDKSAQVYSLSKATGTPAPVIENDPEFEARLKAKSAAAIVNQNPQLRQFITSDPSAVKVSSDDLGQLDTVSKAMDGLGGKGAVSRFMDFASRVTQAPLFKEPGAEGFEKGFDAEGYYQSIRDLRDLSSNPLWKYGGFPIAGAVASAIDLPARLASGVVEQAADIAEKHLGSSAAGDVRALLNTLMIVGAGTPGVPPELNDIAKAVQTAKPYVEADRPIPVGIDPTLDKVKKEDSAEDAKSLKEAFTQSLKSATRERAPELYRDFLAQHVGEDTVGVSADTVASLYGSKTPEAGDGVLGFVKDIGDQYLQAMVTGSDIQVPIADMMTYMDPEVFKAIEPGIRPREDGFTQNEAKGVGNNDPGAAQDPQTFTGQGLLQAPSAIDMSKVQGVQYAKAIAEQQRVEYEAALRKAEAEETKRASPEWRANTKDMRDVVIEDVSSTPKFYADMGIRRGDIPKLDGNALTDEQKAGLPRMYWSAKDGMLPDRIANVTGHASGDDLVQDLSTLHANRQGVAPEKYLTDLVNRETQYRMETKHGKLGETVLETARELTLSQTNLDLMHAELEYLAAEHGQQMPFTKEGLADQARNHIGEAPLKSVSSDRFMAAAARAGNRIEAALLSEDPVTAFKARQEKWASMVYAKEAAKVEAIKEKFDKIVSRYAKMTTDSIPATYSKEWVNQIHDLMIDFGLGARRSIQNVSESIRMDGFDSIKDFAAKKSWAPEGFALRDIPVPDDLELFPHRVDGMKVDQFKEFHNLMASLDKGAREDGKIDFKGQKVDFIEKRDELIQQMKDRFGEKKIPPPRGGISDLTRRFKAASTPLETILSHVDHWIPGDFFHTFVRPYADASAYEDVMLKETNAKMVKANEGYDMQANKKAKNDFWIDPRTNQPVANWQRRNTMGVLANVGNESNMRVLSKGWGHTPEEIMNWLHANTTPEDWKYMERVGKIQNEIFEKANKMGHDVSGVATDRVPLGQIVTPHGVYDGWYHQLIPDVDLKGYAKSPSTKIGSWGEDLESGYFRATTNQGWGRTRTGAIYHVLLDIDGLPLRMKQMIHDIAVRPTLIQLNKFFTDKKFQQAMSDYVGRAQADELTPFLRDFAGSVNFTSRTQQTWGRFFGTMAENTVSGLIAFNPGTIAKHNLTALAGSLVQVGPKDFAREMFSLTRQGDLAADSNWRTAHEKFVEVQRRMKTFHEMLGEAKSDMTLDGIQTMSNSFGTFGKWLGHAPIAGLDLLSTVPTANAAYRNAIAAGANEGEAVSLANRAVRETHGSSTITSKPQIARVRNPFLKPFVPFYAFFNHILKKQFELASDINEAAGLAYGREFGSALAMVPRITGLFMAYVIVPTVVEQMISPYADTKHDSWGTKAAKMIVNTAGSSYIGVRDLTHAIVNGTEAGVGIYGEMGNTLINPIRDLARPDRGSPQWRGRFMKDMLMLSAMTHGLGGSTPGNTAKYMSDYFSGLAHPRGPMDWMTGLRYGTNKGHSRSGAEWLRSELGVQ